MAESKLCSWRQGDILSAQRLNMMTSAINANTAETSQNTQQIEQLTQSSFNAVGGLPEGRFISTLNDEFLEARRGVVIDSWDYKVKSAEDEGVYVRTSGYENALNGEYPLYPCWVKLGAASDALTKEIVQTIKTDEFGKVQGSCISLMDQLPEGGNCLWSGAVPDCQKPAEGYKLYRRLGRVIRSCFEFSEGSNPAPKVLNTNDLIMPILPARAEKEEYEAECRHTVSLLGQYKDNSFLVKNIANAGGMRFETSCPTRIAICSGVEFHKACVTESEDSTTGETKQEVKWPEIAKHIEPNKFDITVACIPIVEQVYTWDYATSSWQPKTCADSVEKPKCKGTIKIQAKTLCDTNWMIGWTSTGKITIPVKDFDPSQTNYKAGRGINICATTETVGEGEDAENVEVSFICNTMTLCAGCGITICEPTCGKYKISSCKVKKIVAGCGICVVEEQCQYKISSKGGCVKLTAGDGISVTGNGKCWKICNTRKETTITAGCGICVVQNGSNYKVSVKAPCHTQPIEPGTTYVFDSTWFTVSRE